jgi:hypothetical protein
LENDEENYKEELEKVIKLYADWNEVPYGFNKQIIDSIKALLSSNKKLKRVLALISETCIDVSKLHISEKEGIKEIVKYLGEVL